MQKRTREKIALLFLVVLIAALFSAIFAYISMTARPWNVAASVVDEASGRMKGYTALVYAGTVEKKPATYIDAQPTPLAAPSNSSDVNTNKSASGSVDTFSLAVLSHLILPDTPARARVTISDVRDLYERRNASVLTLDTRHPERYAQPSILYAPEKRVGIFYVDRYFTNSELTSIADALRKDGAQAVVCIAKRAAYLPQTEKLDVAIMLDGVEGDGVKLRNAYEGFKVYTPNSNEVGAVVLSANNTAITKVISVL